MPGTDTSTEVNRTATSEIDDYEAMSKESRAPVVTVSSNDKGRQLSIFGGSSFFAGAAISLLLVVVLMLMLG
ncbi:MAG: hypothetical protein QNJ16_02030 [Rhodobacter sp.]|nr:hypothetical protein [Rhodobacter sp.]